MLPKGLLLPMRAHCSPLLEARSVVAIQWIRSASPEYQAFAWSGYGESNPGIQLGKLLGRVSEIGV